MTIDRPAFTSWPSLAAGLFVGLASVMLLLFNGKIAGISGIAGGLMAPMKGDIAWRVAFLSGLIASPLVYGLYAVLPPAQVNAGTPVIVIGGLSMLAGMALFAAIERCRQPFRHAI